MSRCALGRNPKWIACGFYERLGSKLSFGFGGARKPNLLSQNPSIKRAESWLKIRLHLE